MSSLPPPPPPPPPPYRPAPPPPPPSAPGGAASFDFDRGLKFFFEDPNWQGKILYGSVFALLSGILVGIPFLMGYYIRVTQRVARGETYPLPEWDDLGGYFSEGLKATGIWLAYILALMVPVGCIFGMVVGGLSAAGSGGGASDAAGAAAALGMVTMYGLMFVGGLAVYAYLPAALTRYALSNGDFGTAFQVGENVAFIKRNLVPYLLALLLGWIANFVAQFGILLCCVGLLPLTFWATCVLAWGMGEVARMDPLAGR